MDVGDVQSDLQALKKLYGLLKNDGCSLQNENSEYLDHKARLLLRNLLDAAAERTFKAHAETLAARRSSYDTACSTKQEKSKEDLKLQPPPFLSNVSNYFSSVVQSTSKDSNTQKSVLEKDEVGPSMQVSQVGSSEQSGLKIFASQPQVRMKRCRVCQRSKAKQLKLSNEPKSPDWGIPSQQHNLPFQFGPSNLLEKGLMPSKQALQTNSSIETQNSTVRSEFQNIPRKPEEADQISKEASFKILQIESRISDLLVTSKPKTPLQNQYGAYYELHKPMNSSDPSTESASSVLQAKRRLVSRNDFNQLGHFVAIRNDMNSRPVSQKVWEPTQWHQVPNQFRETEISKLAIPRTFKPLPPTGAMPIQTASQNVGRRTSALPIHPASQNIRKTEGYEYDRLSKVGEPAEEYNLPRHNENQTSGKNARVIIDRIESVNTDILVPEKLQGRRKNENLFQNRSGLKKTTGFENAGISEPSTPSVRSKFSRLQEDYSGSELRRTRTKGKIQMPDQKMKNLRLSDDQWEKDQGSVCKKNDRFGPRRFISQNENNSESTGSSRSRYASSWTSQEVSTSFSDDEGYSVSSQTRTHRSSGSSTSIESELYSRHGKKVGPILSRSWSDSEMYSVSSRTRSYPSDSDSSGESQDYLSSDDPGKSRKLEKKQPGRLKKLKDKLAIIFHHHHHHHHHHHGQDDDNSDSGSHLVVKGGKTLWKHAGKILDRRKKKGYEEKAVKKIRPKPDKNQRGHFHALVDGLLQHVRHTKKSSKPPKGGGAAQPKSGGKKVASKLHWWQMLRQQKGRKMPKKAHGKVGVGRRKPKLKALPQP